jgi:hypothetical protein
MVFWDVAGTMGCNDDYTRLTVDHDKSANIMVYDKGRAIRRSQQSFIRRLLNPLHALQLLQWQLPTASHHPAAPRVNVEVETISPPTI